MTNTTVSKFYGLWLSRLVIATGLVALSTATPLFSLTVGGLLSVIGDRYGNKSDQAPTAYVILGGGLTKATLNGTSAIVLNAYSEHRTQALWHARQKNPLPIIISGVESPWIKDRLTDLANPIIGADVTPIDIHSDNASMNTCENARFTAKLISHKVKQGRLAPTNHVYLVSDWYHMARARRQFAKVGFATTPIVAHMPTPRSWTDISSNLNHSRRAFYETVALLRDMIRPQKNCRLASDVDIVIIKTPRRKAVIF